MSDINDSGWAVGRLNYLNGPSGAYLWRNGSVELIAASETASNPSISESGDVLVSDADGSILWRNGVTYHAADIAIPGFDGTLKWMTSLTDDGHVLGIAEIGGIDRNVLLTPIPLPGTVGLFVVGGLLSVARRRR